jgi:transcriptional regulator with XRE-family HTH domain
MNGNDHSAMATQEERKNDQTRQGVGLRLKAARNGKGLSQKEVAARFDVNLATVSAWETGIGDPGIYRLRELAKLYGVAADALLWEDSLTPDAMRFAADFDSLSEEKRSTLRAFWSAFISTAATDEEVERKMPVTKGGARTPAQETTREGSEKS